MLQWCPAWALDCRVLLVADDIDVLGWRHHVFKAAQGKRKLNPSLPCAILSWFLLFA